MKQQAFGCPLCGATMITRVNRRYGTKFFGCPGFPKCRGSRSLEGYNTTDSYTQLEHIGDFPDYEDDPFGDDDWHDGRG